ncbi:hypothetical protein AUP07_0403 [methanogenic archaeon mixed culture ISO4-G1]|nr:hypothetical protein AUP07_0403 [methanogenic archaeon mixed culture ISO4-G1]
MKEVYDWLNASDSPGTVSADSMLYGIGCMNYRLLNLIDRMRLLIPELGKLSNEELTEFLADFDNKPFGINVKQLRSVYDEGDIIFTGMEQAVKDRNYFIHDLRIHEGSSYKKDAIRLYNLLNNIATLSNQVSNAMNKTVKKNSKKQNVKDNELVGRIDSLIKKNAYDSGLAELSIICLTLESEGNCFWKKHKAAEAFTDLGYEVVPWSDDSKVLLIGPRNFKGKR